MSDQLFQEVIQPEQEAATPIQELLREMIEAEEQGGPVILTVHQSRLVRTELTAATLRANNAEKDQRGQIDEACHLVIAHWRARVESVMAKLAETRREADRLKDGLTEIARLGASATSKTQQAPAMAEQLLKGVSSSHMSKLIRQHQEVRDAALVERDAARASLLTAQADNVKLREALKPLREQEYVLQFDDGDIHISEWCSRVLASPSPGASLLEEMEAMQKELKGTTASCNAYKAQWELAIAARDRALTDLAEAKNQEHAWFKNYFTTKEQNDQLRADLATAQRERDALQQKLNTVL